jgi:hypothetical protein
MVSFTPRPLYPRGKSPGTHWIGWVDLRVGMDDVKRKLLTLLGLELRPLDRPARSQSLYRLCSSKEKKCGFQNRTWLCSLLYGSSQCRKTCNSRSVGQGIRFHTVLLWNAKFHYDLVIGPYSGTVIEVSSS